MSNNLFLLCLKGIEELNEESKLAIALKAMNVPSKKKVKPQFTNFMATHNKRTLEFNEHAPSGSKMAVPFFGHKDMSIPALLDLLVKWALKFKINIVNTPKPISGGKVCLFIHHLQNK